MKLFIVLFILMLSSIASAEWIYKDLARYPSSVTVHDSTVRLWGREWQVTVIDDNGKVWEESIVSSEKDPSVIAEIAEKIISDRLLNVVEELKPEIMYKTSEVESLLKEKGYLEVNEKLEDLKPLSEIVTATEVESIK